MRFDAALSAESRSHQSGIRVSTCHFWNDGRLVLACTAGWQLSVVLTRLAIEARTQ